jgi:hypothetical protein
MRRIAFTVIAALMGLAALAPPCLAAAVAIDFVNASRATRCAEEDNVYVKLHGPAVAAFRLSAEHPPYIAAVRNDSTAPDFTHCDMSQDPSFSFTPRTVVLYEDARFRLVGHSFATFWRPDVVDFHVGDKLEAGLHLVQLLQRGAARDIEILVVYPADGYWRPKPLPPATLSDSAYGSSFLFGPIEENLRPYVAIKSIRFEPATLTFRLAFANGSRGVLSVSNFTRKRLDLALTLAPPLPADRPFAALRSMFVTPAQADVAVASWPAVTAAAAKPILEFEHFNARSARFGRRQPSQHNLSAPDLVFDRFTTAAVHSDRAANREPPHAGP